MKKIFSILMMSLLLASCMTSNFSLTGKIRKPLPSDHPIKIVLTKNINNVRYEEIGVLQVKQSDMDNLPKAIDYAKKEARVRGGDILFLISSSKSGLFSEDNSFIFVIGRIKNIQK